jgi:hypothetical protein
MGESACEEIESDYGKANGTGNALVESLHHCKEAMFEKRHERPPLDKHSGDHGGGKMSLSSIGLGIQYYHKVNLRSQAEVMDVKELQ